MNPRCTLIAIGLLLFLSLVALAQEPVKTLPDTVRMDAILKSLSPEQIQQLKDRLLQSTSSANVTASPGNSPSPTSANSTLSRPALDLGNTTAPASGYPTSVLNQTTNANGTQFDPTAGVRMIDSLERAQSTRRQQKLEELQRFGSTFFNRSKEELIASDDLAIPGDYRLVPGDQMNITTYNIRGGEETALMEVDDQGQFLLPGAGPIKVEGLNKSQVDARLNQAISSRYPTMRVNTTYVKIRKIRVFVLGESVRPGGYLLNANATVLDVLLHAGGPSPSGSYRRIKLERQGRTVANFDLYDLLLHGTSGSPRLQHGDRIFVPLMGADVAVGGEVQRPAIYELRNEKTLADVVKLAGGLRPQAYSPVLKLERVASNRTRKLVDVPFSDARKTVVQPGDFLYVNPVLDDLANGVYIDGSVRRPGWYQLTPGMKVSDLVRQAEGLKDNTYAAQSELFRMVSRTQPLRMIGLDLGKALIGDPTQDMKLQSEDRIVVYSREEATVDKERVRIQGEVKTPGEYSRFSNMKVRDLITMAGGVTPEASMRAEVARPGSNGRLTFIPVDLDKVLASTASPANFEIRDLDVLVIRKELRQKRWPASVVLVGEFNQPGEYVVDPDRETLADVVRRAGGMTDLAYPKAAVFTRLLPEVIAKERSQLAQDIFSDLQEVAKQIAIVENLRLGRKVSPGAQLDFSSIASSAVIPPRKLDAVLSTGRVPLDLATIVQAGTGDPRVKDGDVLFLPQKPEMVIVSGAVVLPSPIVWRPNDSAEGYIRDAGGFSEDASEHKVLVLRVNGTLLQADRAGALEPGDLILVPPKALVARPEALEQFLNTIQAVANGALIWRIFR
jgi:polysaccharide biosynthesis/export protein